MKHIKYLNAVLTVIAFCLFLITLTITGLIPSAYAKQPINNKYVQVPINPDGSITVKFSPYSTMDVNLKELNGMDILGGALNVNVWDINYRYIPLPVKIQP